MYFLLMMVLGGLGVQEANRPDLAGVTIINESNTVAAGITNLDGGPVVGNMLNVHYFPGLQDYAAGRFSAALGQMNYVIGRPDYLDGNPRQAEFMSTAHYLRGMIYLYHATGIGKHKLARTDFESSIKWNPGNYIAYLELSRVYSALGFKEPAATVLRTLLALKPDAVIAQEATAELQKLESGASSTQAK